MNPTHRLYTTHCFYADLIQAWDTLPALNDICADLREELCTRGQMGPCELSEFCCRMIYYVEASNLSNAKKNLIFRELLWGMEKSVEEISNQLFSVELKVNFGIFLQALQAETINQSLLDIDPKFEGLKRDFARFRDKYKKNETLEDSATLQSPADLILGTGFTLDEADRLARAMGLTDEAGNYCLGPRKLGAVVGFALALQQAGKLTGAIPALTAVLGPRWGVQVATRKTTTTVAQHYFSLTTKALTRPKKTD